MTLRHLAGAVAQTAKVSVPTILDSVTGGLSPDVANERLELWSRKLLDAAKIEITVEGPGHPVPPLACVVMSNHQSLYDIPVLYQSIKRPLRMVAKSELFRVPIWAAAMRAAGFIEVRRQDRDQAIQSLNRAVETLKAGISVWIAPEGTRSKTGRLGPFKKGGFHLAIDAGAPILPVSIDGTRHALSAKGGRVTEGAVVRVWVGEPIETRGLTKQDCGALLERVRGVISERLPDGS